MDDVALEIEIGENSGKMDASVLDVDVDRQVARLGRDDERGLSPGGDRWVLKSALGAGGRRVLRPARRLENEMRRTFQPQIPDFNHEIIATGVPPVAAEERLQ